MKPPLRNLGSLVISDAGSRLIGFLITAYLARVLAPSGFGVLSIGMAVLGHLATIGSPGIQIVEMRNVAARRSGSAERIGGVLAFRLVLAFVLLGLTWVAVVLMVESHEVREVVFLYAASLLPYALFLDWYFQGREDFVRFGVSRLVMYSVFGVVVFLFVRSASDLALAPVAFFAGNCAAAIFLGSVFSRTEGWPVLSWDTGLWRTILRDNISVGVAAFFAQAVSNFPPLVVGYFLGNHEVGLFSASLKLVFLLLIVDRLFGALYMPVVTRYASDRSGEMPFLLTITLKVLLILLIPVTICGVVLSPAGIMLVFGSGYEDAAPLVQIMMGFFMLTVLNTLFLSTLVGAGRERAYSRSMMVGTGILAIAVVVLTSLFGAIGAAGALLIGEMSTLLLMVRAARAVTVLPALRVLIRPALAGATMACALWLLHSADQFLACGLAIIAYAAVIVGSATLSREEFRYLRERFV